MMNENIHRINDIIKQVPGLRYDCSVGNFECHRRDLYDFAELIVRECIEQIITGPNGPAHYAMEAALRVKKHFGVEE